jgi:protein gp37
VGDKTAISWADHTFNIWWGCEHAPMSPGSLLTSPECDNCYAQTFDHRLGGEHWGPDSPRKFFGDRYWTKPIAWNAAAEKAGVRARVFCSSMADWAERRGGDVGAAMDAARARIWALIRRTPWLDWLMLTKRAENLATMLPWIDACGQTAEPWPNVWPGVTCGARSSLWRIPLLRAVPAVVRFVSCEPLLEHITADDWDAELGLGSCEHTIHNAIDWLIVGDESGPGRRPADLEWVRTAREAAERHGASFHFKQWNDGGKVHLPILDGVQHAAFPEVAP